MFRVSSSITKHRLYKETLNYIKNVQNLNNNNEGAVNKIKKALFGSNHNNNEKTLYSITHCPSNDDHRKKHTNTNTKQLKKDLLAACRSIRKSSKQPFLLSAAGLTISPNAFPDVEPIPDAPHIPDASAELLGQLNALGEPTFASLGLGGWSPVGLAQHCFEYMHVTLGLDWWAAIALGTLIVRLCLFPLVVVAQRNAAKMNNYMPQMQLIQMKMSEARQTGNQLDAARYSQELMLFMKEKGCNPFKNMIVPLAQMPIFVSFFVGLRQMANIPVPSLETGGLWWFTNLTMPDQFFIMPVITSLTLYATIELGTDSAKLSAQNMQLMKYVLRALPVCILPFTMNFPGAILCYWVSSHFISLMQVGFLRIPTVREYFNIEKVVAHSPGNLPMKPKGFKEGLKDSWNNIKITKELEERTRLDEIKFQKAGRGPIVKTYKFDPTKQQGSVASMSAKKR